MSPNINDLRKILVSIISKLSMSPDDVNSKPIQYVSIEDRIKETKDKSRGSVIKNWLQEDWIHP